MFDPAWAANGHTAKVVDLFTSWVKAQALPGLSLEVLVEEGRTPLIFMEVASTGGAGTVLMYGHLDKQVRRCVVLKRWHATTTLH